MHKAELTSSETAFKLLVTSFFKKAKKSSEATASSKWKHETEDDHPVLIFVAEDYSSTPTKCSTTLKQRGGGTLELLSSTPTKTECTVNAHLHMHPADSQDGEIWGKAWNSLRPNQHVAIDFKTIFCPVRLNQIRRMRGQTRREAAASVWNVW